MAAAVPNDVAAALGNGPSVGNLGEEEGGSQYQGNTAEAEQAQGWKWSPCDVGIWELTHVG